MPRPETPLLAADIIIELESRPGTVILIERRNPPHGWALPGGFVDVGESVESAARREAKEETCLDVELQCLLGVYSRPDRDPRGHTVSAVFVARASGDPQAADDAKSLTFADPAAPDLRLVFDHRTILDDYLEYRRTGSRPMFQPFSKG